MKAKYGTEIFGLHRMGQPPPKTALILRDMKNPAIAPATAPEIGMRTFISHHCFSCYVVVELPVSSDCLSLVEISAS